MTKANEIMDRLDNAPNKDWMRLLKSLAGDAYDLSSTSISDDFDTVRENLREAFAELEAHAMPEGMEWPRYEDGEFVPIGGEFMGKDGKTYTAKQIQFIGKCFSLYDFCDRKPQFSGFYGERVRHPAVPAADGEPLEAGQTVWNVNNGMEFTVSRLPKPGEYQAVEVRYRNGSSTSFDPDQLTHQRPVLDADGVPIKEGDTVYLLPGEWCDRFPCLGFHGGEELKVFADGEASHVPGSVQCREKEKKVGIRGTCYPQPEQLTNTKPEPPDSWERIERGIKRGKTYTDECVLSIVRRCKALAERGE